MKTISGCEFLRRKSKAENDKNILELCSLEDVYIDCSMHDNIIKQKDKTIKKQQKIINELKKQLSCGK